MHQEAVEWNTLIKLHTEKHRHCSDGLVPFELPSFPKLEAASWFSGMSRQPVRTMQNNFIIYWQFYEPFSKKETQWKTLQEIKDFCLKKKRMNVFIVVFSRLMIQTDFNHLITK